MGSSVWAGHLPLEDAYKMESDIDQEPGSVYESLRDTGYLGDMPASYQENEIDAHFELHTEQGPRVGRRAEKIGIVTGVQACYWEKINVHGVAAHAGSTPMEVEKRHHTCVVRDDCHVQQSCQKVWWPVHLWCHRHETLFRQHYSWADFVHHRF